MGLAFYWYLQIGIINAGLVTVQLLCMVLLGIRRETGLPAPCRLLGMQISD